MLNDFAQDLCKKWSKDRTTDLHFIASTEEKKKILYVLGAL